MLAARPLLAAALLLGRTAAQDSWEVEPACGCVCDPAGGGACSDEASYPGYCADMWGRDAATGEVVDECVEDGSMDSCHTVSCQSDTPPPPPSAETTYALMNNGMCASGFLSVDTFDACIAAAIGLGLDDVEPAPVVQQPQLPQGCFYKPRTSSLYYNAEGVSNNLSPEMQALCTDAPGCIMDQLPPFDATWGAPHRPYYMSRLPASITVLAASR
jgi:hypothetical protein